MFRLFVIGVFVAFASSFLASPFFASPAFAGAERVAPAAPANLYSVKADGPVAAVQTAFAATPGQAVRVTIYDSAETFLEAPFAKRYAHIDERGLAIVPLHNIAPGEYSIAAYLDENGDGKLNRGKILGIPKEPIAFSNGVIPKLSRPSFDETKVSVGADSIVLITLED